MKVVVQRVKQAAVTIDDVTVGQINHGLLLLVGFADSDDAAIINKVARKIANMRIFNDADGKMNCNVSDVNGSILSVSQFTLYADIKHGNRPSFTKAGESGLAKQHYVMFNHILQNDYHLPVATGYFGADMQVSLVNDGPVTIIIDTDEW